MIFVVTRSNDGGSEHTPEAKNRLPRFPSRMLDTFHQHVFPVSSKEQHVEDINKKTNSIWVYF